MSIDLEILRKINLRNSSYGSFFEIYFGGPRSLGVQKFYEGVGVLDRGHRDLSNGVKIVTLRLLYLELYRI